MPPVAGVAAAIGGAFVTAAASIGGAMGAALGLPAMGTTLLATTALTTTLQTVALKAFTQIAIGVALGAISRWLLPKPKGQASGTRVSLQFGETNPLSFIMGIAATPGELLYHNAWDNGGDDTPNEYYVQVFELSDMPARLRRCYINGEWVKLKEHESTIHAHNSLGRAVEGYERDGEDRLFVKFYDGTQTVADPYLIEKFGSDSDRPWTSDMIGLGMAYAIVTAGVRKSTNRQKPECKFELDACWYDRRRDSSQGGHGAQRYHDRRTWKPTNNPIVLIENIMRGIRDPITDEFIWGGQGITSFHLPANSWFAAMNACDDLITTSEGEEPEYRAGMEIIVSDEPASVIEEFLKACVGVIAEVSGKWYIRAGGPGLSVYDFTDHDVVVTAPDSFNPIKSVDESINGISGSYVDPDAGWVAKDAPLRLNQSYLAQDFGKVNIANITYPSVPYPSQVQRLMKKSLDDERRARIHTMVMPPECQAIGPLDDVTYSSVRNGYDHKLFSVEMVEDLEDGNVSLAIRERDPSDYDFGIIDELPKPIGYRPTKPRRTQYTDFSVEPWIIKDGINRSRAPAIKLNWTVYSGVTAIRYMVRLKSTEELIQTDARSSPKQSSTDILSLVANGQQVVANNLPVNYSLFTNVKDGFAIISGRSILPMTEYEVNAMYEPIEGRDWLPAWLSVTTPDIRLGPEDFSDQVNDKVDKAAEDADQAAKQAQEALDKANAVEGTLAGISEDLIADIQDIVDQLAGINTGDIQEIRGIGMAGLRKDGWVKDPTFSEWSGGTPSTPLHWTSVGIGGYATKLVDAVNAPFPTSMDVNVPSGVVGAISISASSSVAGETAGVDPKTEYVVASILVRCISGSIADSRLQIEWRTTGTSTWTRGHCFGINNCLGRFVEDWGFAVDGTRVQSREHVWQRPVVNTDGIRVVLYAKATSTSTAAVNFRVDFLNFGKATDADVEAMQAKGYADAQIAAYNTTIVGPGGAIAASMETLRTEFGDADAEIIDAMGVITNDVESLAFQITTLESAFGGTNLVKNPQFSDGVKASGEVPLYWDDWDAGVVISQKTVPPAGGAASQNAPTKYFAIVPGDGLLHDLRSHKPVPIKPGEHVTGSLLYATSGTGINFTFKLWFRFYNADDGVVANRFGGDKVVTSALSGAWTEYNTVTIQAPAGSASFSMYVRRDPGGSAHNFYFTQVQSRVVDSVAFATASSAMATAADANDAVSTITDEATAEFGSFSAMVSATATAYSSAQMSASAYVIRTSAEGAFKIVSWDDEDATGTAIVLEADNVIAPGTLSTGSLVVTDLGYNMVPDDQLQSFRAWTFAGGVFSLIPDTTSTTARSKGEIRWTKPASAVSGVASSFGRLFPVRPGQRLMCSYQVQRVSAARMRAYAQIRYLTKDQTLLALNPVGTPVDSSAATLFDIQEQQVVPANAYLAQFQFNVDQDNTVSTGVRFWSPKVISNEDASVLITPDQAFFAKLQAEEAWIKNAMIANLTVGTIKIMDNAISNVASGFRTTDLTLTSDDVWVTVVQAVVNKAANECLFIFTVPRVKQVAEYRWTSVGLGNQDRIADLSWRMLRSSTVVWGGTDSVVEQIAFDVSAAAGSLTYTLQLMQSNPGAPSGGGPWINNGRIQNTIVDKASIGLMQTMK